MPSASVTLGAAQQPPGAPRADRRATLRRALCGVLLTGLAGLAQAQSEMRIVSPEPEETVHSNTGRVAVIVANAPRGARFKAWIDGEVVGGLRGAAAFELDGLARGAHVLEVDVIDAASDVRARLGPVTFYVWQASRQFQ